MPTWLSLLGGIISLAVLLVGAWYKKNDAIQKAKDDEDKKIDSANNADDIMRISGELR